MNPDTPTKSCFNCTKRRIVCDLTPPECNKCLKKGLVCPGYGIRYRFTEGRTAPTPGPNRADVSAPSRRRNGLKWVSVGSVDKLARRRSNASDGRHPRAASGHDPKCTDTTLPGTVRKNGLASLSDGVGKPDDSQDSCDETHAHDHEFGLVNIERAGRNMTPPSMITLPPFLSHHDPKMRLLLHHFNVHVSPVMLMYDDESNGYRHQILPMAHSDPVVARAVCIAAAFHLSQRMPELRLPAESGRAAVLRKLTQMECQTDYMSDTTWATILLLIVADLVTGHEHVLTLYNILSSYLDARGHSARGSTPLSQFLYYQSRLISFFAHPVLGESKAVVDYSLALEHAPSSSKSSPSRPELRLTQQQLSFLVHFTPTAPQTDARTEAYIDAMRCATEMYLLRAQSATIPVDGRQMASRLAHMRELFRRVDPGAPGSHTLVWPAFVAAAEAQEEQDRTFFAAVLKEIWQVTGYANVLRGLEALPGIWSQQGCQRWTATLPDLKSVVM